jgi:glucan phosphoethanolaminetransferase (alkaline phosphatase superfamily)
MPGATGRVAQVLSSAGSVGLGRQIQAAGFYLAGLLCLVFAVLKLTGAAHWSWWRVFLPLWVILGHNALYIAVGFVWLFFVHNDAAEEELTIRENHRLDILLLVALLGFLISADNLLVRIEGHHETVSFWLRSGRGELIFVFGLLSAVCQLLFWSGIVRPEIRRTNEE